MYKETLIIQFLLITQLTTGQEKTLEILVADSAMTHSSISLCILNISNGEKVYALNEEKSLVPASVLKIFTSSAALELLGPDYTFKTAIGYSGNLNKHSGRLNGNIIIKGGGDPALGSTYFKDHYKNFLKNWIISIMNLGIKEIEGKIITDDSRYDYQPSPSKWLWEDIGNYYGAGAYGLSVFDNTFEIHFNTLSDGSKPFITRFVPDICRYELSNYLIASGDSDKGFVFSAPYSKYGWIAGTVPVSREDFVLKAAINDPPLLMAKIVDKMLDSVGIDVSGIPSTTRIESKLPDVELQIIAEVVSPPLKDIITVLNHESVNLFAEHLLKELGKIDKDNGTTASGIEILYEFLSKSGINTSGIFLVDGSGVSPLNAITSRGVAELLLFMRKKAKHADIFYASLPDAGKEGTLKNYFKTWIFESNLKAKSGSMTRVRSFAGYFNTRKGNEMAFSIIINNYSGSSQQIIGTIEAVIQEIILQN